MKQYWKVQKIEILGKDVIDEFRTKSLSFLDDDKLLLPVHKSSAVVLPLTYSRWKYRRDGLFNGVVEIDDLKQSMLNGHYEIEILKHQKPQQLRLKSEKIEIYLKGVNGFSLENQTIRTK